MIGADPDPAIRRFERDAVLACAGLTAGALAVSGGRWDVALGVVGGGLLTAASYGAIKGGVNVLAQVAGRQQASPPPRRRQVLLVLKFFARYALLAVSAYVMLTCFRLHPAGLAAGVTSPFLAAVWQVGRMWRTSVRGHRS